MPSHRLSIANEALVTQATLAPGQAVNILNDRVKRISKTNIEIADWLSERRRVEEQYVQGLRKLTQARFPNSQSELGYVLPSRCSRASSHS
jgi:F-BAR domain only protein